jgi:hypothetical protein
VAEWLPGVNVCFQAFTPGGTSPSNPEWDEKSSPVRLDMHREPLQGVTAEGLEAPPSLSDVVIGYIQGGIGHTQQEMSS